MNKKYLYYIMRISYYLFILFFVSVTGYSQKPIAHYPFDNSANDVSGNNNDGIIHGAVVPEMDRFGSPCGAYRFDGVSSYIEVPSSSTLESLEKSFTITIWYKFDNSKVNNWLTVVCKGGTNLESLENPQYRLQVQQNSRPQTSECSPAITAGSSTISINSAFTECDKDFENHRFPIGKWAFYAIVYNGQTISAYMNGSKIYEENYNQPLQKNKTPLYIGMDEPGNTEYFEGSLDDLYIYDRALPEKELLEIYNENRSVDWSNEEFEMIIPNNKTVNALQGCSAFVNFESPKVSKSSCGNVIIRQTGGLASGSAFSVGSHLISYQAISTSGYVQSIGFYVIVKDITSPILRIPSDTIIYYNQGQAGVIYSFKQATADDNCGIKNIEQIKGPISGDLLKVGKYSVRFVATDNSNNISEKEFTVTVKENQELIVKKPVITTKDTVIQIVDLEKDTLNPVKSPKIPIVDTNTIELPKDLLIRENIEIKAIEVESRHLTMKLFDNGEFDGDTVSIILNNKTILSKQLVNPKGTVFTIDIDTTIDNELIMYAENLGFIPPNTALLILTDDKTKFEINLLSTLKTNGVIRIRRKK